MGVVFFSIDDDDVQDGFLAERDMVMRSRMQMWLGEFVHLSMWRGCSAIYIAAQKLTLVQSKWREKQAFCYVRRSTACF